MSVPTPATGNETSSLTKDVVQAFDNLNGVHPGFRPAHAKGVLLSGTFTPSKQAATLTDAVHLQQSSTPVSVRFSDFAGIPAIPDNDDNASPRGMAIRFHLGEHVHTDIVAHSMDGFPTRTAEEFVEFLRAAAASGPDVPHPKPIEVFLGSHPAALAFVQAPKPIPTSFARESYFAVNAYKFTSASGLSRYGRYQIRPEEGTAYLSAEETKAKTPNFLMDEIKERVPKRPAKFRVFVQIAATGDVVDDGTIHWPKDRAVLEIGTIELTGVTPNNAAEQQRIIFDPIPRLKGIEPSADPLLKPRADVYLMTGRRRRAAVQVEQA